MSFTQVSSLAQLQSSTSTQLPEPASGYTIIERNRDSAVFRNLAETIDASGSKSLKTNEYTLLDNGLHYQDNGEWKVSEDVIEAFPTGAVARKGPHKTIFSNELNTKAAFDTQTDDGERIQGGVRAILLTDTQSGQSLSVGTVKQSVKGTILPPNTVIWADAFDGIKADVAIIWKHNLFRYNVLLREQPEIPKEWNPDAVVLQVVTEFYVDAEPHIQKVTRSGEDKWMGDDHAVIQFGAIDIMVGKAFSAENGNAFAFGSGLRTEGIPVHKQWLRTDEGRDFLLESVPYTQAAPHLKDLPVARQASVFQKNKDKALASLDQPGETDPDLSFEPMQLASAPSAGCSLFQSAKVF